MKKLNADETDLKLLKFISKSKEQSYKEAAKKLGATLPTIYNRIDKLKKKGILKGIHPVINCEKLGFDLTAFIQLKASQKKLKEIVSSLKKEKQILEAYAVSGEFNLFLIAKYRSTEELHNLIEELSHNEDIEEVSTSIVYNKLKEEIVPF